MKKSTIFTLVSIISLIIAILVFMGIGNILNISLTLNNTIMTLSMVIHIIFSILGFTFGFKEDNGWVISITSLMILLDMIFIFQIAPNWSA
jgi:hypothetical protein